MNVDLFLFQFINQFAGRSVLLNDLGIFFAQYFEYFLLFALFLFLVKNWKKYWLMIAQSLAAAVLARLVITNIIRWLWFRPRPFIALNFSPLFNYNPAESSFPSGHAAFYFAIATIVFLFLKKVYPRPKFWWGVGLLFYIASFLIVVARVFSGIHWPSDILAGAAIGIISGWLIILLSRKFFPKLH